MFKELLRSLRKWQMGNPYAKAVERMMPPGPRQWRVCQTSGGVVQVAVSLAGYARAVLSCCYPVC